MGCPGAVILLHARISPATYERFSQADALIARDPRFWGLRSHWGKKSTRLIGYRGGAWGVTSDLREGEGSAVRATVARPPGEIPATSRVILPLGPHRPLGDSMGRVGGRYVVLDEDETRVAIGECT